MINQNLHDSLGFNMFRLINGDTDIQKIVNNEHSLTCCGENYTLEIYMKERYLVQEFNQWFSEIYPDSVDNLSKLNTKSFNGILNFRSIELNKNHKLNAVVFIYLRRAQKSVKIKMCRKRKNN